MSSNPNSLLFFVEIEGPESDEHLSARMQSGASPTSFTPYAFDSTITFSESFDVHNYLAYLTPSPPADESDELDDPGSDSSLNTAEYPKLIEHGPFGDQLENDPRQEDENKHSLRNCITFLNCSSPRRKTELSIDKYLRYLEEDNAKVEEISLPEISRSPSTPDLLQSEPRADVRFGGGCSPLVQSPPPLSTITEESFNIDEYLRYFYGEGINDQSIVVSKDDNDINRYLTYLDKEYLDNWIDACNSLSEIVDVVEDKQPSRLEQLRARKKEILTSSQQKIAESRKSLLASRLDCKNIYQDEELPVANRKNEVGTDDDRKPTQEIDKYLEYLTSTSQDGHMSCSEEQNEADIDSLRNLSVGEKLKPILLNSETDSSSNDSVSSGDDQNAGGAVSLPSVVSGGELGGQQCSSIIKATDGNLPTVQITVQRSVLKELQPRVH